MKVVTYLRAQEGMREFTHNKSIGFSCGNFRPDVLYDYNTHFVVVEIDEEQHSLYDSQCEEIRMSRILVANGLPTVFLRYNPDAFKIAGLTTFVSSDMRLAALCKRLRYHMLNPPAQERLVEYLYFNT
jgi:hypothetical protein